MNYLIAYMYDDLGSLTIVDTEYKYYQKGDRITGGGVDYIVEYVHIDEDLRTKTVHAVRIT